MTADHDPVLHEVALILERRSRDQIALTALHIFDGLVALPAGDPGRAALETELGRLQPNKLRDRHLDVQNHASRLVDALLEEARTDAPSRKGIDRRLGTWTMQGESRPHSEPFTLAEFEAATRKDGVRAPAKGVAELMQEHGMIRDVVLLSGPSSSPGAVPADPGGEDPDSVESRGEPATPRQLLDQLTGFNVESVESAVRSRAASGAALGRTGGGQPKDGQGDRRGPAGGRMSADRGGQPAGRRP